jgi:hypothetical protein
MKLIHILFFSHSTTDETLRAFCSRFGKITDCLVMRNPEGKSRGFGFVTYEGKIQYFFFVKNIINEFLCCIDTSSVEDFMRSRPHTLDNRQIDPKRASMNLLLFVCLFIEFIELIYLSATRRTKQFRSTFNCEKIIRGWFT